MFTYCYQYKILIILYIQLHVERSSLVRSEICFLSVGTQCCLIYTVKVQVFHHREIILVEL